MQFAKIVGNPPFGNLHLKIIDSVIPHLEDGGVGCFIHPARWLEDPLAGLKKNSDQVKFKGIIDRLEEVKIMDTITVEKTFGITRNGDLMISKVRSKPTGKKIEIYDDIAKKSIEAIVPYSKEHNLEEHVDENQVDGGFR